MAATGKPMPQDELLTTGATAQAAVQHASVQPTTVQQTTMQQTTQATGQQADTTGDGNDLRAKKRQAIGLAPERPTAKSNPQRPPDESHARGQRAAGRDNAARPWWLTLLMTGLIAATTLLIVAKMMGAPTAWPVIVHNITTWPERMAARFNGAPHPATVTPDGYRVAVDSQFTRGDNGLVQMSVPGQYEIGPQPDQGLYRMKLGANQLAWSSPGLTCLAPHRLEAEAVVASETADGYAGVVGRLNDGRNFYLFAVDGQGRYQVQLQRDGLWSTLRPWTSAAAIQPAGIANHLRLDDDGRTVTFAVNDTILFSTDIVRLPAGSAGVAGGAQAQPAQVDFSQFTLYDLPCRGS